jgi:anaerobic magnesium-protoporphyrin IX monomethyl ester cyclase
MMKRLGRFLMVEAQPYWEFDLPFPQRVPHDAVPPLGLAQLAAVIRERDAGAEVRILDLRLLKNDYSGLPALLKQFNPDFVGFRGISRNAPFMASMVKEFRKDLPEAIFAVGGPHATAVKGRILNEAPFDFGVFGEGERTLCDLLDHIEHGGAFEEVPGLVFRSGNGEIRVNEPRAFIDDLDSIPMPAWDLVDHEKYFEMLYMPDVPLYHYARREIGFIFTSRACPYRCTFCHSIFGKKFRAQSPEKTLAEMEYLYHKIGIRQFSFADDVFNLDRNRVLRICKLIREKGLDIKMDFPNGLRGDIMDEELVEIMRAAGMYCCTYALETGSPRLQKELKKNINIDRLLHMMRYTSSRNIIIRLNLIIGFPTETREEMLSSIQYGLDPSVDLLFVHSFNPFEGTELTSTLDVPIEELESLRSQYDYYNVNFSVCGTPVEELRRLRDECNKSFFTEERIVNLLKKRKFHNCPGTELFTF